MENESDEMDLEGLELPTSSELEKMGIPMQRGNIEIVGEYMGQPVGWQDSGADWNEVDGELVDSDEDEEDWGDLEDDEDYTSDEPVLPKEYVFGKIKEALGIKSAHPVIPRKEVVEGEGTGMLPDLANNKGELIKPQDFSNTISNALGAIRNQVILAGQDDGVSIRQMELRKHQSASLVDAVEKVVQLRHACDLLNAAEKQFKREKELEVLNPVLDTLKDGVEGARKRIAIIQEQLNLELEMVPPDIERVSFLQLAEQAAFDHLQSLVTTLEKTILLERKSGGRGWGKTETKGTPISYVGDLDGDDEDGKGGKVGKDGRKDKKKRRRLSSKESRNVPRFKF